MKMNLQIFVLKETSVLININIRRRKNSYILTFYFLKPSSIYNMLLLKNSYALR